MRTDRIETEHGRPDRRMTDTKEQEAKRKLGLTKSGRLELKVETGQGRESFPHGRTKTVQGEVRKKRTFAPGTRPGESPAVTTGASASPSAAEQHPARMPGTASDNTPVLHE